MKISIRLYFGLFLLLTAPNARAQSVGWNSTYVTNPPDLSKMSYEEADKTVSTEDQAILLTRVKTIGREYPSNLIYQIRHNNWDNDKMVLAVWLLGELDPTNMNSVEVFIEHIDLKASKIDPKFGFPRWGLYPAKDALLKSGKVAVIPLMTHLANEANELRRQLMCEVLVEIEGWNKPDFDKAKGQKIVETQIKEKLASESDPAKRTNLELALKEVAK